MSTLLTPDAGTPLQVCRGSGGRLRMEGALSPDSIQNVVASHFCDLDMTVEGRPGYQTLFESMRLGRIELIRYCSEGMQRGVRRWEHIRRDHADYISLYLPQSMEFVLENAQENVRLSPGSFAFLATNRPFSLVQYHDQQEDSYASIYVKIPAALIRQRLPCIDDLCLRAFTIAPGAGSIMRKMLEAILDDGPSLSDIASERFGDTVLNVIAEAAEWAADAKGPPQATRQLSRERVVQRAKLLAEERISDPALDTSLAAEHCGVSVRYLLAAFSDAGQSFAAYVRQRRLQLCRAALRDRRADARTITQIAGDWGFSDPSHFGRLYREQYGCTPRQERERSAVASTPPRT